MDVADLCCHTWVVRPPEPVHDATLVPDVLGGSVGQFRTLLGVGIVVVAVADEPDAKGRRVVLVHFPAALEKSIINE